MGSFWATGVVVMVGRKGSTQCLHHVPGVSARVIRGQKNEDGMREVAFPYAGAVTGLHIGIWWWPDLHAHRVVLSG
jgi:hypothetical protein